MDMMYLPPSPPRGQIDVCEDIIFPQLRLRVVKMTFSFLIVLPQLHAEDLEERKKREAQKSEWQPPKSDSSSDEGDTDEEIWQDEDLRK